MDQFQIIILHKNQTIESKWLSDEYDLKPLAEFMTDPSVFTSLKFPDSNGDFVIIMEQALKNSIVKIKKRTV